MDLKAHACGYFVTILFVHGVSCFIAGSSASVVELKTSTVMQRLAGWMPTAIRGEQSPGDLALSLAARELKDVDDTFIFALCQDHRLRMWSYKVESVLTNKQDVMRLLIEKTKLKKQMYNANKIYT